MYPVSIFAQTKGELCSTNGYTVITINGMNTDEKKAILNRDTLKEKLPPTIKNEQITVEYIHNPSHLAGLGDIFAVAYQKYFDTEAVEDYDLIEILNDASTKVKTQKLLLVGHSQGNFYSNSFYDKVVDKDGGVPKESIGVYGVASPSSRVAGGGKYITSGTDTVISNLRWKGVLNILPSNEYIKLPEDSDSNGHSFSDVYMKYRSNKIISDIKYSLNKLKTNNIQNSDQPCISPQEVTFQHKITGAFLEIADPTAIVLKKTGIDTYNQTLLSFKNGFNILANVISGAMSLASGNKNNATV
ncbi:hypothetical protein K8Q94_00055 [Candidatus Nomurabacteria bacterium]|nr:hypothetical protein [Candidatus Nomurabacteria bacterium]